LAAPEIGQETTALSLEASGARPSPIAAAETAEDHETCDACADIFREEKMALWLSEQMGVTTMRFLGREALGLKAKH
jgi:hypothetical protein